MKGLALFDFDGTITRHDTLLRFGLFAIGRRRIASSLLKSSPWILLWKLGAISNSAAKERLFGHMFGGMQNAEFERYGREFAKEIDKDLRKDTLGLLEKHQDSGDETAIVSASIGAWIRPWAKAHGIGRVISTEVEVDGRGRLTGKFSTPNCHGPEKARRIRLCFPDLEAFDSVSYGDSRGDFEMFALTKSHKHL
ncbi:MAG: haloacid dehalogenase-like hydrolase [Clostridium sp.]|nr:haloacid dehalogenase-like hydrolase [Clostridium sp.]